MNDSEFSGLENARLVLQEQLDGRKTQLERNRLGQFATPTSLAVEILRHAGTLLQDEQEIRFLDPALGTGSFYSALLKTFPEHILSEALGFEVDPHYALPAKELWDKAPLKVRMEDFTRASPPNEANRFNLLVCNPPYVRHHHLQADQKIRLKTAVQSTCGIKISGLAGLYCYFLALGHSWLSCGGLAAWLIPSEFMDVNYGASIKRYLLNEVTLLHVHRFDPSELQFGDALVSSSVVWFRKAKPSPEHRVRFSFGGTLLNPSTERRVAVETLRTDRKWTRHPVGSVSCHSNEPVLSDYFQVKRGLATGDNGFFILSAEEIAHRRLPVGAFQPILPSPRHLKEDEISGDEQGNPRLARRLFLLNCRLEEKEVETSLPELWNYLEDGKRKDVHRRYLCRHRSPWYSQEKRPAAPILCTYLGRSDGGNGRPFRFILNASNATAANVYLMLYPKDPMVRAMCEDATIMRRVWTLLNELRPSTLLGEGRVYGGGLHKLEPRELGNVPVGKLLECVPSLPAPPNQRQASLLA